MSEQPIEPPKREWVVRIPIWLRGISGFLSAVTSTVITVIFSLTIYEAVLKTEIGYPSATKILIMIIGPLISSFQFINISAILAAVVSHMNTENDPTDSEPPPVAVGLDAGASIEQKVYGDLTVLLRSVAGFICGLGICFASLTFTFVIHLGVIAGKGLPSDLEMAVVISGPIITSWTFMRAETTIKSLLKIETISDKLKAFIHRTSAPK